MQCRCGPIIYYLQQNEWRPHSLVRQLQPFQPLKTWSKFPFCKSKILPWPSLTYPTEHSQKRPPAAYHLASSSHTAQNAARSDSVKPSQERNSKSYCWKAPIYTITECKYPPQTNSWYGSRVLHWPLATKAAHTTSANVLSSVSAFFHPPLLACPNPLLDSGKQKAEKETCRKTLTM